MSLGEESARRIARECAMILDDSGAQFDPSTREIVIRLMGVAYGAGPAGDEEETRLGEESDAAAARIIGKFPELESTNIVLLRQLLAFAWLEGTIYSTTREQRRLELELVTRAGEL